jgi:hypothetical protein
MHQKRCFVRSVLKTNCGTVVFSDTLGEGWGGGGGSAYAVIRHFVTSLLSVEKIKIAEIVFDIELRFIRYTFISRWDGKVSRYSD